jgi:hypothetical protein
MSFYTGTQSEVLFAGPPAPYAAVGASSTAAANAFNPATGNYQQPLFAGGFWQQGRTGQTSSIDIYATVSGQSSATTLILALQLSTAANTLAATFPILTFPTLTVTSFSSAPLVLHADILNRGSGFGISSVATNLETSGWFMGGAGPTASQVWGVVAPTALQTTDFSVNQWLTLSATFSTNSASNTMTVNTVIVRGEN